MSANNNNLFWNSEATKEKLADLQKLQSEFTSQIFNQSAELQKKQFALLNNILQNQVEFSSQIFSSALNIINDNAIFTEKKAARNK